MPKIKHVVVLMMENHSFDNILGLVGYAERSRRGTVDGLTLGKHGKPTNFNRDRDGRKVFADDANSPCQLKRRPTQTWNASHQAYANGANSGFVKASGPVAMRFFDKQQLPFTLLAGRPLPDRPAVLLLGPRPDLSQPAVPVRRHRLGPDRHQPRAVVVAARRSTERSSTG